MSTSSDLALAVGSGNGTTDFRRGMLVLLDEHRPSRMPFFRRLASLPFRIVSDPDFLGEIYLVYQAAMHATRAAVCYLPHLDSPGLEAQAADPNG